MKNIHKNTGRTLLSVVAALIGIALLGVFLMQLQGDFILERQRTNSRLKLDIASRRLEQNNADFDADWLIYDEFSLAKLNTIAYTIDSMPDVKPDLAAYAEQWQLDTIYLCDAQGIVLDAYNGTARTLEEAKLTHLLEGRIYDAEGDLCFFKAELSDGRLLVGGRQAADMFARQDARITETNALRTIQVGENGYVAAIDMADGSISYARNEALIGQNAEAHGLDPHAEDGKEGMVTVNGSEYYAMYQKVGEDTLLVALADYGDVLRDTFTPVFVGLAVFAFVVLLIVLYSAFLRSDIASGKISADVVAKGKLSYDRKLVWKLRSVLLIGVAVIFLLSWYAQSLAAVSRQRVISEDKLNSVQAILDENDARIAELTETYQQEYSRRAENIAWTLAYNPALVNDEDLAALAERAQVLSLWVFDRQGRAVSTSSVYKDFVLSDDPESQSYPFWDVVKGYKTLLLQELRSNDVSGRMMQYVGVQRMDDKGMVQLGLTPDYLEDRLQTTQLSHVLDSIAVENGGMLFAVDGNSKSFVSYPDEKYIGRSALDLGLSEAALKDGYIGYQNIDGSACFVSCVQHGETLICIAVPTSSVNEHSLRMALLTAAASLVLLLVLLAICVLSGKGKEGGQNGGARGADYYEISRSDGGKQITQSAQSRWSGVRVNWNGMLAGQKLKVVAGVLLILVSIAVIAFVGANRDADSILSFISSQRWERSFNIFSVSYVAIVLLEVCVISVLLRRLIFALGRNLGTRGETVGRLLNSFIKYAAVIGALFYCLQFFGFDSGTLLASAGILTLIIGLGAQTLVADILAGIFIVFEGEFRVGDIVDIGGWGGTVQEIGIRTTKVKDGGDNVKIFHNSAVSGVVNKTKQYSYAAVDVGIEYDESLERVEAILKDELPRMRERLPGVVDGPFYKGVSSLGDSAVVIKIVAQCHEGDRAGLERALMREIKLTFDRHNVGIPFPQVVINKPNVNLQATPAQKRKANEFVVEQEVLTRNISDED